MLMKKIAVSICCLAIASASVPVHAFPIVPGSGPVSTPNQVTMVEYRGNRGGRYRRHYNRPRHRYRSRGWGYGYGGYNDGAALALGLLGLGIGLAIASSANNRYYRDSYHPPADAGYCPAPGTESWHQHCEAKYRSYRRSSGTYTSFSGNIVSCRCP